MDIYINNTRTFGKYLDRPHHHDLMLANHCMAGAYEDQRKVELPKDGDLIAIYANGLGIIAYGFATSQIEFLDDDRVGGNPTKVRKLRDFQLIAYPIHHSEYETSNTQTLQKVSKGKAEFYRLLLERKVRESDPTLFVNAE